MAVERQRPPALTAGLEAARRSPPVQTRPGLNPGLRAASPALMAGLCLTGRQGQFHPKSSKNYTSSATLQLLEHLEHAIHDSTTLYIDLAGINHC